MWPPNCIAHVRSFRFRETGDNNKKNLTALLIGPRIFPLLMMQLELRKGHVEIFREP